MWQVEVVEKMRLELTGSLEYCSTSTVVSTYKDDQARKGNFEGEIFNLLEKNPNHKPEVPESLPRSQVP